MQWLVRYLTQHPRVIAGVVIGITLLALPGITQVTLAPTSAQLFLRHSAAYRIYQQFLHTFGNDETILVALHDPHHTLLTPDGLMAVRQLTLALADVPQVESVLSLTNAPDLAQLTLTLYSITVPPLLHPHRSVSRPYRTTSC
jgi:predicted RND superfamily exporter protein